MENIYSTLGHNELILSIDWDEKGNLYSGGMGRSVKVWSSNLDFEDELKMLNSIG